METESWQLREIQSGLGEMDSGMGVSHEKVSAWLRSWGKKDETKAPS